jgi:hypothetical protein
MLNRTAIYCIFILLNSCDSRNLVLKTTLSDFELATQTIKKSQEFYMRDSICVKFHYKDFSNIDSDTFHFDFNWYYNFKDSIELAIFYLPNEILKRHNLATNCEIAINDIKLGFVKYFPAMSKLDYSCAFKKDSGWFHRTRIEKLPIGMHPKFSQIKLDTTHFNYKFINQTGGIVYF